MSLDKIYTLQTGVSLKVSTIFLQELITNILNGRECSEIGRIRCATDLYDYLSVIVYKGADGLIKRRQHWVNQKNKADLVAGCPIPFREFSSFFWRNLDESDPDGDEWIRLIAEDGFYSQLSSFLNKLRAAERTMLLQKNIAADFNLGSV
jgi:hypothetical protein